MDYLLKINIFLNTLTHLYTSITTLGLFILILSHHLGRYPSIFLMPSVPEDLTPAAGVPLWQEGGSRLFLLVWPPLTSLTSFPSHRCPHLGPGTPSAPPPPPPPPHLQRMWGRVTQPSWAFYGLIKVAITRSATVAENAEGPRTGCVTGPGVRIWCRWFYYGFQFHACMRQEIMNKHIIFIGSFKIGGFLVKPRESYLVFSPK